MKNKVVLITIISFIVVVVGVIIAIMLNLFNKTSEQQIRFMTEINAANSIIWYYGDLDPGEEITINYEKVTEFTAETIGDQDDRYSYHAIIIFDFDGQMDITDEELLLIKEYCENNYYDMLYYGTAHLTQFQNCGYFTQLSDSACGFVYNASYWINRDGKEQYLNPYLLTGNWNSNDNANYDIKDNCLIWKFVIQFLVDLVEDSYGEL